MASPNVMELLFPGCSWYDLRLDMRMASSAHSTFVANEAYGAGLEGEPPQNEAFTTEPATAATLLSTSRALDDLRDLGGWDIKLNHSQPALAKFLK